MPKQQLKGYMAVTKEDKEYFFKRNQIQQEFKGLVFDKEVKFPKGLGIEHPFNFEAVGRVYKKTGIISGGVNKFVDSIVGDFSIKVDNENAEALLNDFIKNTQFSVRIRNWVREAITKGNGFMEIDLDEDRIRVLAAEHMYVRRNKKGKILGYNQFAGSFRNFSKDSKEVTPFDENQIAHLPINQIASDAYGLGIVWPNERVIENLILGEQDVHRLIARKAGSPYHIKVGVPGEQTDPKAVDNVKGLLTFMNTRTEWVTDANVNIEAIQLADLGKSLFEAINHDVEMLSFGMEIPVVLFGKANVSEGLANAQSEIFQRKIQSIREVIEAVIEEKIFKPILLKDDFQESVEFVWNLPGEDEINKRIEKITALLNGTIQTSPEMRAALEIELAKLFNFEGLGDILVRPGDARKMEEDQVNVEREREEQIPQPEVPGAKPNAKQSLSQMGHAEMTVKEFINLKEFANFTYSDYVVAILKLLSRDKFTNLRAITNEDIQNGLLEVGEIDKLRVILKDGFKNNQTISDIETRINNDMALRDRLKDGKLVFSANFRANMIARSETVRLANRALINLYGENNLKQYQFLAALSDRTCPICESLNSQVFNIKDAVEGINLPAIHSNCRCTTIGVIE